MVLGLRVDRFGFVFGLLDGGKVEVLGIVLLVFLGD